MAGGVSGAAVSQWEREETTPELGNYLDMVEALRGLARSQGNDSLSTRVREFAHIAPNQDTILAEVRDQGMVPLLNYISAGDWGHQSDAYVPGDASKFVPVDGDYGVRTFALEIEGESMLPDFKPGDVVIIDPDVQPMPGDFVVAKRGDDDGATFKRLRMVGPFRDGRQEVDLVPLNQDWPTLRLDEEHPGRVVGVMVEHRSFRRRARTFTTR